jgi:hypothetical protein
MTHENDPDIKPPFGRRSAWREIVEAMPTPLPELGKVDLVLQAVLAADIELWRSPDRDVFLTVSNPDGARRMPVRSIEAERLIRQLHAAAHPLILYGPDGTATTEQPPVVTDNTVKAVQATLESMASRAPVRTPRARVAEDDGAWWFDLGDATNATVRMTAEGSRIVHRCSAPLIRPPGMLATPRPRRSDTVAGEVAELFGFYDSDDFMTLICALLDAMRPGGSHIVLIVWGDDGAGKSALCRFIRSVVDPHEAGLEALPQTERDLAVAADSCRMLAFDNVSVLTPQQADWICRLSTGFVFRVKKLYKDRDISCFTWCGPVVLNGIPSLVARSDLASRVFLLRVGRPTHGYIPERELERKLARLRPGLLALVLDGVVVGLKHINGSRSRLPRLADAAAFCMAAAPAFGWTEDQVGGLFQRKHAEAMREVANNDPVAAAVIDWLAGKEVQRWPADDVVESQRMGTLGKLHSELTSHASVYAREWPKLPNEVRTALRRVEGALAAAGVRIAWSPDGRRLSLSKEPPETP